MIALMRPAALGSSSVNVLPWPGPSLSANARPPCFLATERTMNSPRPLPFARIGHARRECGRSAGRCASARPARCRRPGRSPHGERVRRRSPRARRGPRTCAGEYLTALSIRFQTAAFSSSASPTTIGARGCHALLVGQRLVGEMEPRPRRARRTRARARQGRPACARCAAAASRRCRRAAPARWCAAAGRCPRA